MTAFFMNQQNEVNNMKHINNSLQYNTENNVQSTLKQFINGTNSNINPYSLIGGPHNPNLMANTGVNREISPDKKTKSSRK